MAIVERGIISEFSVIDVVHDLASLGHLEVARRKALLLAEVGVDLGRAVVIDELLQQARVVRGRCEDRRRLAACGTDRPRCRRSAQGLIAARLSDRRPDAAEARRPVSPPRRRGHRMQKHTRVPSSACVARRRP